MTGPTFLTMIYICIFMMGKGKNNMSLGTRYILDFIECLENPRELKVYIDSFLTRFNHYKKCDP